MADDRFDVIVIGAGPGGYVAAIRCAQLGLKTACVEKRKTLGGTCLNVGCIPSKALLQSSEHFATANHHFKEHGIKTGKVSVDLPQMMKRKEEIVDGLTQGIDGLFKKNKVTRLIGTGKLVENDRVEVDGKVYFAKNIILATGSEATPLPFLPFDEKRVLSSTGALSLKEIPKHLLVIGGGVIGLELGSVYQRLGSQVTVIEFLDTLLPGMDREVCKEMAKLVKKQGIELSLETRVEEAKVTRNGVKLTAQKKSGEETSFKGDYVLVSIGRRPYTEGLGLQEIGIETEKGRVVVDKNFATNIPGVYAIGDLIDGPMLAHKAEEEAVVCAEIIAQHPGSVSYLEIPGIVYTQPEVAGVGFTEEECKEANIPIKKGKFPLKANPRARCIGEDAGFVKIISHAETDRVLGVHIIGFGASELIAEAVVAMSFKASAQDIAMICHGHPTLSEAIKEAALGVHKQSIHI